MYDRPKATRQMRKEGNALRKSQGKTQGGADASAAGAGPQQNAPFS